MAISVEAMIISKMTVHNTETSATPRSLRLACAEGCVITLRISSLGLSAFALSPSTKLFVHLIMTRFGVAMHAYRLA
jgi:hypothetical protein